MSTTQTRKERERAERHRLIISAARELAEAEGWDAVTTRRLAERIEYSQPVLYSHFAGKGAIVDAVALEGIGELAGHLERAVAGAAPGGGVAALATAYTDFAAANPALYEAMFSLATTLSFGTGQSPPVLVRAFTVLMDTLAPYAGAADPETFVETVWSALHGLVLLDRGGRLRPGMTEQRLAVLVGRLTGA
ncbi:TetR/AcrR family transcriptional regulator [Kitasatospora viridis]|uniref:TetR family transcriptional regulator n=1 Tax=Kitasatospora viridis TaxID=281105 RepID=A0A561UHQ4_9ACTN|nr:TetR/AcrR family transcriptional regulator [Kitasatospora viridis]TWF98884.1 TetR family transcriptional regulator [Kitasatospora viridis]